MRFITSYVEDVYESLKSGWKLFAAALAAYLLYLVLSPHFSNLQLLTMIVVMNAAGTFELYQKAARKPERPNKKFLKKLNDSEPIKPKHNPPKTVDDAIKPANKDERRFFTDFAPFADVVNSWLADEFVGSHWRLQELPDLDVSLNVDFTDGPTFGRCYEIFHNQVRVGRLEIQPLYDYRERPRLITEIEIEDVRLFSLDSIVDFLGIIAMHTCEGKDANSSNVGQAITFAATKSLWGIQRMPEYDNPDIQDWGTLELNLSGKVPGWYFDRRDALLGNARV